MPPATTFGDYIRSLRDSIGIGLREASRRLGISPSYLSRLEADLVPPPKGDKLHRIAEIYGADIHQIMELSQSRAHETMAADADVAPAIQAFYRLAQDKTPAMQERMLKGALEALDLPEDKKSILLNELKAALSRSHGQDLPRRAQGDDGLFGLEVKPRFLTRDRIEVIARTILDAVFDKVLALPIQIETIIQKYAPEIVLIIDDDIEGGYLRDGAPAVLGLSRWSCDGTRRELVIHGSLFEDEASSARRRCSFTMAHELFHCIEHLLLVQNKSSDSGFKRPAPLASFSPQLKALPWFEKKRKQRKLSTNEDWREWQANAFAASILMPEEEVCRQFDFLRDDFEEDLEDGCNPKQLADVMARANYIDDDGVLGSLVRRFDVNPQAMAIRLLTLGLIES